MQLILIASWNIGKRIFLVYIPLTGTNESRISIFSVSVGGKLSIAAYELKNCKRVIM